MATKLDRDQLNKLVEPHWRQLYNFVFRLTLDRDRAERYLADVFTLAIAVDPMPTEGLEIWLLGLANKLLEERLRVSPRSTSTSSMTRFATRPRAPTWSAR